MLVPRAERPGVEQQVLVPRRIPAGPHDHPAGIGHDQRAVAGRRPVPAARLRPAVAVLLAEQFQTVAEPALDPVPAGVVQCRHAQVGHRDLEVVVEHRLQAVDVLVGDGVPIRRGEPHQAQEVAERHAVVPRGEFVLGSVGVDLVGEFAGGPSQRGLAPRGGIAEFGQQHADVVQPVRLHRAPVAALLEVLRLHQVARMVVAAAHEVINGLVAHRRRRLQRLERLEPRLAHADPGVERQRRLAGLVVRSLDPVAADVHRHRGDPVVELGGPLRGVLVVLRPQPRCCEELPLAVTVQRDRPLLVVERVRVPDDLVGEGVDRTPGESVGVRQGLVGALQHTGGRRPDRVRDHRARAGAVVVGQSLDRRGPILPLDRQAQSLQARPGEVERPPEFLLALRVRRHDQLEVPHPARFPVAEMPRAPRQPAHHRLAGIPGQRAVPLQRPGRRPIRRIAPVRMHHCRRQHPCLVPRLPGPRVGRLPGQLVPGGAGHHHQFELSAPLPRRRADAALGAILQLDREATRQRIRQLQRSGDQQPAAVAAVGMIVPSHLGPGCVGDRDRPGRGVARGGPFGLLIQLLPVADLPVPGPFGRGDEGGKEEAGQHEVLRPG